MSAGRHDIKIDQGADFTKDFVVKDLGVVRDLTGYSARAEMRTTKKSATVAATFVCTIPNPTLGEVNMALLNATTAALTPALYWYDLELYTASDADVIRLVEGRAHVSANITKP